MIKQQAIDMLETLGYESVGNARYVNHNGIVLDISENPYGCIYDLGFTLFLEYFSNTNTLGDLKVFIKNIERKYRNMEF